MRLAGDKHENERFGALRAVVQRVSQASVQVNGALAASIGEGLVCLVAVRTDDTDGDVRYIGDKLVNLRIFEDEAGKLNRSLLETGGDALLISQFTLYGDARKGRRPGFIDAANGEKAIELYEALCEEVARKGVRVGRGVFGADMKVALVNDGPVTILLDSRKEF